MELKWFSDSPDMGSPECICSYVPCSGVISEVPVRIFREDGKELRFHFKCFDTVANQAINSADVCTGQEI